MSAQDLAAPDTPQDSAARAVGLIGLTLALAYAVVLYGAYVGGHWLFDPQGRPIANDFVNVWAAGKLALEGHAADAYDWTLHKAMEVRAVGHAFDNYYGWHYPPMFFFAAAILAQMPYAAAMPVWLGVTLLPYVAAMRGIVGERAGFFVALGFPAGLWNATAGQNGFLTAALIGGTLGLMERHPALAGVCLGLLSYKPHFGLLFPIVLIASRRWRVFITAAITAFAMAAASWIVFGHAAWQAFFRWMPVTGGVVLGDGAADWQRLQSLFGLIRSFGGGEALAWSAQSALAVMLAIALAWLWRSRAVFELKAAALATGALLATPYLYIYDLVALAIPVAFLLRLALKRGFSAAEMIGLPALTLLLLAYPYAKTQVGFAAALVVALLIAQRAWTGARHTAVQN